MNTFRPRQIAEGLKIELSSHSILKLDGLKMSIPLETTQEIVSNYVRRRRTDIPACSKIILSTMSLTSSTTSRRLSGRSEKTDGEFESDATNRQPEPV